MQKYQVQKVSIPPDLQGKPTGKVWDMATPMSLVDCVTGEEPHLGTLCKLLWDDEYLYVGYEVEDNTIIANFTERDEPLYEEDVVEIFLSPSGSEHYYYEFNFSPKEVIADIIILNDGGRAGEGRGELIPFKGWNVGDLHVATHIQDSGGWSVTAAIPFRELHFAGNQAPTPGDQWRANLCRIEYGEEEVEYSTWSQTGLVDFHTTERFGMLLFE